MPIISRIGSKSWKVRLVYFTISLLLTLGAVTMLYPLMLMLAGSARSEADTDSIKPYPQFWFDDVVLFQKYVESKHRGDLEKVERAWAKRIGSWRRIARPDDDTTYLADFLAWRDKCEWWYLGHWDAWRLLAINGRAFRQQLHERFNGDIFAFRDEMGVPLKSWTKVGPPNPQLHQRYPLERVGMVGAFADFARTRPTRDRVLFNPDGHFWSKYLLPKYGTIEQYNEAHGTEHTSYRQVFLSRFVPENELEREAWETFVRTELFLGHIRLSPDLRDAYQRELAKKYGQRIEEYNKVHPGRDYTSFDQTPLPTSLPERRDEWVDWEDFIKNHEACPAEGIEVHGPRQQFESFVAQRRGVALETVTPIRLPIAAADWRDCMHNSGHLRWEFTTRNYKYVLDYILHHGNGIRNTIIYCVLAVGLALLVNPLAAYALSSSFALFEALSDGGWRGIARKVSASKTTKLEYV